MTDSSQISLLFCCRAIKPVDILSLRQFYLKVSTKTRASNNLDFKQYQFIGNTQTFKGIANPNFQKRVNLIYHFSKIQQLKVQLLQKGKEGEQPLAQYNTTLDNLLGSRYLTIITKFYNKNGISQGRLLIRVDTDETTHYSLYMNWRGGNIANVDSAFDFWDKNNPYLKFLKIKNQNVFEQVAQTQTTINNLEPNCKPIIISANMLGWDPKNLQSVFRVQCWDYKQKQGNHELIGFTYIQNQKIKSQDLPIQFILRNPQIKNPGILFLDQFFYIQPLLSFLNVIRSGIKIDLLTVTDFTKHQKIDIKEQSDNLVCLKFFTLLWQKIQNFNILKQFQSYGFRGKSNKEAFFPLHSEKNKISSTNNLSHRYFNILSNLDNFQSQAQLDLAQIFTTIQKILIEKRYKITDNYLFTICPIILNGYKASQTQGQFKSILKLLQEFQTLPVYIIIVDLAAESHLSKMMSLYEQYLSQKDANDNFPLKQVHFSTIKQDLSLYHIMQSLLKCFPDYTTSFLKKNKIGINVLPQLSLQYIFPNINPLKDNKIYMIFGCKHITVNDLDKNQGLYLKIYLKKNINGNLQYLDRTQIIQQSLSPIFKAEINAAYIFQMKQSMKVQLYRTSDKEQRHPIGILYTSLTEIMGSQFQTLIQNLLDQKQNIVGKIGIRVKKKQTSQCMMIQIIVDELKMSWRGSKLGNVHSFFDFFNQRDPYLRFLRNKGANVYVPVIQTQIIQNSLEPNWKPITISANKLGIDVKNPLAGFRIQCWDFEVNKQDHELIGQVYVTVNQIKNKKCPISFTLLNQKQQKVGILFLEQIQFIQPSLTFMNVIKSGLELNLIMAVDLSIPILKESLNQKFYQNYQHSVSEIISNIWNVVQNFNKNKSFLGYGFQSQKLESQQIYKTTCFPLKKKLNEKQEQIQSIDEFKQILKQILHKVVPSDEIELKSVLKKILQDLQQKDLQKKHKNDYQYNLIFIIINQINSDLRQFIDFVVKNCVKNSSIAIIGINQMTVKFNSLNKYNKEEAVMNRDQIACSRDMLQFMEFTSSYKGQQKNFAFDLLKRVSWQILDYYKKTGIGVSPKQSPSFQQMLNHTKKGPFFEKESEHNIHFFV